MPTHHVKLYVFKLNARHSLEFGSTPMIILEINLLHGMMILIDGLYNYLSKKKFASFYFTETNFTFIW